MTKQKKNKTNRAWVNQHITDPYVISAARDKYRSRAAYKLLEIDSDYKIFAGVKTAVDLGCSPGSWSQVLVQKIGANGKVIGVDLLPTEPMNGLDFILGDFTENDILDKIIQSLDNQLVDLVLSDMSPNLSGIKVVDQARSAYLIELVLDFAKNHLKQAGDCIMKVFHGCEFDAIIRDARALFSQVIIHKPRSSRDASSEVYIICRKMKC